MRRFRTSVVLLALGLVAGCTTSEAGEATPGGTTQPTQDSETPSETSASVDIPPPPRELSLEGLDPCTLFTEEQRAQLRISDVDPEVGEGSEMYKDMKECILDADAEEPFVTYDVVAVTDVDFSYWITENTNADAELISIAGYPAAEFHTKGVQDSDCAIAIGVANNQHLHVEMSPISEDLQQDQICQGSEQAAEMAMQTLQTLK